MSRTANPITTAMRNWALRSPARLALGVLIVVALLLTGRAAITAATGTPDAPVQATATASDDAAITPSAVPASDEEVTETQVAAMSAASVVSTPARAAMFYAHTFVDTTASPTEWALALARVTDPANIDDSLASVRPTAPVTILGPTRTTRGTGDAGTRVDIDTSTGALTATLIDTGSTGWQLDTPLPTVNLDVLPAPTTPDTTATRTPAPPPVPGPPSVLPTTTEPTPAAPTPLPRPAPTTPVPKPVPVPGPIPLPDLDTPLPGPLT